MMAALFNTKQAAEYLGVSTGTLYNWRHKGRSPQYTSPYGKPLYHKDALDVFLGISTVSLPDVPEPKKAVKKEVSTQTDEVSYFNEFWNAYDNKKDRKKCLAIWKRKKLDKIGLDIIAKVAYQHENDPQWPKYQPNPSTYLNGDRWEDEVRQAKESEGADVDKIVKNLERKQAEGEVGFFSQQPEREITGERL